MPVFGVILICVSRIRTESGEIRRIQSKCGKIWTRITPNTDTFYGVTTAITILFVFLFPVEIQCSDNGEPVLSTKTNLSVPVIDINESPDGIFIGDHKIITLNENPIPDQIIGKLGCSDPDKWQSHTYQLNGDSKIYFKVY